MKYVIAILSIVVVVLASCSTQPDIGYCEQAELVDYVTYNGEINRAYFETNSQEYYINIEPETGTDLIKGRTYTLCFDENNNFIFLQEP